MSGFIYCFSNSAMPGIYKIGMTTRTPEERLKDANSSNTWKPPIPYKIAMSIRVNDPLKKEQTLHKLLERFYERIHPRREFFRITLDDVRLFFNLMSNEISTISNKVIQCDYLKKEKEIFQNDENDCEIFNIVTNTSTSISDCSNPFDKFAFTGNINTIDDDINEILYGAD